MADEPTHPSDAPRSAAGTPAGRDPGPADEPTQVSHTPPPATATERSGTQRPVITAVEIENFKGIGRPLRIDLRPITLLFGGNSAGKSTVLHALCYAHEILSGGNLDAHETRLGGDRVDLGGFRRFVHAHDSRKVVRLRVELGLDGWKVPAPVLERMRRWDNSADEWVEADDPARVTRSAWVTLSVEWNGWKEKPVLASYELGVNESPVGRIVSTGDFGGKVEVAFNRAHPLLDPFASHAPARSYAGAGQVREAADPGADWSQSLAVPGQTTPLPDWDELLPLDLDDLPDTGIVEQSWTSLLRFQSLVSALFVGIGRTLREELAALRYIGPMRELRPPTQVEAGSPAQESWSDGTAAWNLLLRPERDPVRQERGLIDDVNDWLERRDRLDAGYRLLRKAVVELPADRGPVRWIRNLARLPDEFRNEDREVDLDGWVRKTATEVAGLVGGDPAEMEARIRGGDDEVESDTDSSGQDSVTKSYCGLYRVLAGVVAPVDELENGRSPSAIRDLVRAIDAASDRTTLELVAVGSELPVRTSDVGTGVSQVLPVVVAALDRERPGITAVEQPELHVHPRLQVELGDLFAEQVDQGGIFLLETHSEHLMLRLLRRIEETGSNELPEGKPPLKPDQVSVVFLEQVDGEVRATSLRIDETGEFIDRWPQGFFDERTDELF